MPHLRDLRVVDGTLAFARGFMRPSLTRLHVNLARGAPLDDWLDALEQLPELEQLHMSACVEPVDQPLSALNAPKRVVHLRRLDKITLSLINQDRLPLIAHAYFLLHLLVPEDTALIFEAKCGTHPQWLADCEYVMTCIHRTRVAASATTRPAKVSATAELQLLLHEARRMDSINRIHLEEIHHSPQLGARQVLSVDISLTGLLPTDADPSALLASMQPLLLLAPSVSLSVHSGWAGLWNGLAGARLFGAGRLVLIDAQTMRACADLLHRAPGDPLDGVEELYVVKSRLKYRSDSGRVAAWRVSLLALVTALRARCAKRLGPATIQVQDRREVLSELFAASRDDAAVARVLAGGWQAGQRDA